MMLQTGVQTALKVLFPARCIGCGVVVESDFSLCGECWRDVPLISGRVCDSCGVPILDDSSESSERRQCDDCLRMARPWHQGRAVMLYRDMGRQLVLSLKHGDRQEVAALAAPWLNRALRDMSGETALIAPVPLHWTRLLKRRFNQSAWLALALEAQCGHKAVPDLLWRPKRTRLLDGLGLQDRYETLQGTIRVSARHRERIAGRRVVILDDVMTTGATLTAAADACLAAGAAQVDVLVLARAAKDT